MTVHVASKIITIAVDSDSHIVLARQKGRELAAELGFGPTDQALIATAISELARNIVSYAKKGEIQISSVHQGEKVGIGVVARDQGPGIPNLALAPQDGFSTSGSLGLGLPGVRRLMDDFDISSSPGAGTTVTGRKWKR